MNKLLSLNPMVINDLRLLDLVPVATYVCDRRGQIQSFNQAAIEVWGQVPNAKATDEAFHHAFNLLNFNGQSVLWVDKGSTEEIRIALRIGKVSDDYATGDSQMTSNILSH
ncbi:hypothetical protein [Leptolyngbya boryana]|uniref:hypothetical protein n=1 Tax=Leptolyngbya boryana TaxID=1184 RepID=UPI00035F8BD1|nr:hypothetical protein [Leptolyngbya boryana]